MERRKFIGGMVGGAALGPAGAGLAAEDSAKPAPLVRTPAAIMAPRPDGVEVVWAVSRLARGRVEWKGADGSSGVAGTDDHGMVPQGDSILRARLAGLKPGGDYQLRTVTEAFGGGGERVEGDWKPFRTLDPTAAASRFAVWNDTHENAETLGRLHAATPSVDFLVWNGDVTNDWHQAEWLVPTLLDPGGRDVTAGRPLLLVWGNHDVRGKWAYKVPEMVATPGGRPFYAFRSGPLAVVCLHTGEDKPDSHPSFGGRVAMEALRREQTEWLRDVIARPGFRDAPFRAVFCHIPLRWTNEVPEVDYAGGGYDFFSRFSREAWHDLLVEWKTQVVVSGHTHRPAWIPANEAFPYAQMTGGGPQPDRATWIDGRADGESFSLVMKNLAGETVEQAVFKPLA